MRNIILSISVLSLSACSYFSNETAWQNSGSIAIAKLAPQIVEINEGRLLGFMPVKINTLGKKLIIDRQSQTVKIFNDGIEQVTAPIEVSKDLLAGSAKIILKAEDPVWYASDKYFKDRSLAIPAKDSELRYKKMALGELAIFLDGGLSLHSAPESSEEISGVRLDLATLNTIYSTFGVGDEIAIR